MYRACVATGLKGLREKLEQFNERPGMRIVAVAQFFHKYTVIYDDAEWREAGFPICKHAKESLDKGQTENRND